MTFNWAKIYSKSYLGMDSEKSVQSVNSASEGKKQISLEQLAPIFARGGATWLSIVRGCAL